MDIADNLPIAFVSERLVRDIVQIFQLPSALSVVPCDFDENLNWQMKREKDVAFENLFPVNIILSDRLSDCFRIDCYEIVSLNDFVAGRINSAVNPPFCSLFACLFFFLSPMMQTAKFEYCCDF